MATLRRHAVLVVSDSYVGIGHHITTKKATSDCRVHELADTRVVLVYRRRVSQVNDAIGILFGISPTSASQVE